MNKALPYGRQLVGADDIQAVIEVLQSDMLTQGPNAAEFESALSVTVGAEYTTVVNSGTSALHIACRAAGVKPGDEVITSPITFVASANCVVYCGAKPVFADIDPKTYNVAPTELERHITPATKAVIPVHFAGQSCDMEAIQKVVRDAENRFGRRIYIIEDACHALGSKYRAHAVGSCAFSDMAVMSFHPVKHITTGEGGAVFTNDENTDKVLKSLRSHGITNDPDEFLFKDLAFATDNSINPWYYEQQTLGYNYRITNIQCALGLAQIKKLEQFRSRRKEIVAQYNAAFADSQYLQTPYEDRHCDSNFHLYVLLFEFEKIGVGRDKAILAFMDKGFNTQVHYIPVHLQPYFQKEFGTGWGDCPNSEAYYKKCLSIPLFPAMTDNDVDIVINEIKQFVN